MRRTVVFLLSSMAVLPVARAEQDTFDHIGRVAVIQRMHRVLDLYQWMRLAALDADTEWRLDVMTSISMHNITDIEPEHRLSMSRTGHVLGVDRLPHGLGVAFFRSSAYDEVYAHAREADGSEGDLEAYAGWKATVMGGQVWWQDNLSLAVGWIDAGQPLNRHPEVRRPLPEVPRYGPAFVRLEAPRFGAAARLDLLGAAIGDVALSIDELSVLPDVQLGATANRWAMTDEVTTGLEARWQAQSWADVIVLLGAEWTAPELRYVAAGVRVGAKKALSGGVAGADSTWLVGSANARRSPLGGPTGWNPAVTTEMRAWITVDWASFGFDLAAGLGGVTHPTPAPAPLRGSSFKAGIFVRIGI